jgi:hypothetical protein
LRQNNWYVAGIANFLQSSVQGIQLQDTFGGAIGRNIVNRGSMYFTVYGGFAWQQINYQRAKIPSPTQQVTTGLLGTQLKLFRFNRTDLSVNANLLPAISDAGRVQFFLNTSYYVKLWGQLNWNLTFYGNWDNRPPTGFASSDYGMSSGLSISSARLSISNKEQIRGLGRLVVSSEPRFPRITFQVFLIVPIATRIWSTICPPSNRPERHFRTGRSRRGALSLRTLYHGDYLNGIFGRLIHPSKSAAVKIHSRELAAPAAHSKRLYRKCSGIRLAPQSDFVCRSTSDRELVNQDRAMRVRMQT